MLHSYHQQMCVLQECQTTKTKSKRGVSIVRLAFLQHTFLHFRLDSNNCSDCTMILFLECCIICVVYVPGFANISKTLAKEVLCWLDGPSVVQTFSIIC